MALEADKVYLGKYVGKNPDGQKVYIVSCGKPSDNQAQAIAMYVGLAPDGTKQYIADQKLTPDPDAQTAHLGLYVGTNQDVKVYVVAPCAGGCQSFSDTFADTTGTAALDPQYWTSASWDTSSGWAQTSTDNVNALRNQSIDDDGMIVCKFRGSSYGDEFKVYSRYIDANNYSYAKYTLAASAGLSGTWKIYEVIAGASTLKGSLTLTAGRAEPNVIHHLVVGRLGQLMVAMYVGQSYYDVGLYAGEALSISNMNNTTIVGGVWGFGSGNIGSLIEVSSYDEYDYDEGVCPFLNKCLFDYDGFLRDDTSGLGSDWTEDNPTYGDFQIIDNELVLAGSGSFGSYLRWVDTYAGYPIRSSSLVKTTVSGDEIGLITQYRVSGGTHPIIMGGMLKTSSSTNGAECWLFYQDNLGNLTESTHFGGFDAKPNVYHRLEVCTWTNGYPYIWVNGEMIGSWNPLHTTFGVYQGVIAGDHTGDLVWDDFRIEGAGALLCECDPCIRISDPDAPIVWDDDFTSLKGIWSPWDRGNFYAAGTFYCWGWDSSAGTAYHRMDYTSGSGSSGGNTLQRCLSTSPRDLTTGSVGSIWTIQAKLVSWSLPSYTLGGAYYVNHLGGLRFENNLHFLDWGPYCSQTVAWEYRLTRDGSPLATGLGTPAFNDVLKMELEKVSANTGDVRCYINNVLVHTESGVNFQAVFTGLRVQYVDLMCGVSVSLSGGSGYTRVDYDDFHFEADLIP